MRQQGTNIVHGNVNGNNNNFNNNNYNIQNGNNGGGNPNDGGGPLAIGFGAIVIMIVVAVPFLRHFEEIYFWLGIGALTGAALSLLAWVAFMRDDDLAFSHTLPALYGIVTGCAALWVISEGYNAITPDMLQTASRPGNPLAVWERFSGYDHRLIGENMATVACLAIAIVLNVLMGLHTLFATLARTEQNEWLASLANRIRVFRAQCGGIASAVFIGVGYLGFGLLKHAQ